MSITSQLLARAVVNGWSVVPLIHGTKRPIVPWSEYRYVRPSLSTIYHWAEQFPKTDLGLITGEVSNVIVLDYDGPPYPEENWLFTETPHGRHYFFDWETAQLRHGLRLQPNLDIPILVRLYDIPRINKNIRPNIPEAFWTARTPRTSSLPTDPVDDNAPPYEALLNCAFIQWFREKRETNWDGRYPLARAYANNARGTKDPDLSLGPAYRHQADIIERPGPPTRCLTIYRNGFKCPRIDRSTGMCSIAPDVITPLSLARKIAKQP